jgi:anthranilate synthase/aminodeoxychorismate synthase-like glutamine amidotransferase
LGHQAIAEALGGRIVRAPSPVHGRASSIAHDGSGIFRGIPSPMLAGRYHSLVADPTTLPRELCVAARTDDGAIMAVQHKDRPVVGVQFHPESVLTEFGFEILANFLEMAGVGRTAETPGRADELDAPAAAASPENLVVTF